MKFVHAGAIYAVANIASAGVPFLLLPLLTRVLGPSEFGQVVNFSLLVTLCLTVAGLNAHAALGVVWFKRSREEVPAYTATALAVAAGSTLLITPVVALALWWFPEHSSGVTPVWGAIAALTAGSGVVLNCRLVLWQSQGKAIHSAVFQFGASVLNVGLSLFAVLALHWQGDGRNAGIAAASVLMACLSFAVFAGAGELRWAPQREQMKTLVAFGLPLVFHSLAGVLLSSADRWTVSVKLGAHELGVYGAGAQLGMVMAVLADAFVKAYSPWLFARLTSDDPEDAHCAVGAVYTAMPTFVVMAIIVGAALFAASAYLLGPQYRAAAVVLPWFMLGGAFSGMYLCTSVMYFFAGRTSLLATVTTMAALCGAATTWLLVGNFGIRGAAIGYAMTQGMLALFTNAVAFKSFDLPWGEPRKALRVWTRRLLAQPQLPTTSTQGS